MQHELLANVVGALDAAGIEHMVTGSLASTSTVNHGSNLRSQLGTVLREG